MHYKLNQLKSSFDLLWSLALIWIVLDVGFISSIAAAKKSSAGVKKMPISNSPLSDVEKLQAEEAYNLSLITPFRYHYTPWITRRLLLTLNMTSTNHPPFYRTEVLNQVKPEYLEYDYECNDPSIIRKKNQINVMPSLDSDDFKDTKDLSCYERAFLQELVRLSNDIKKKRKNHWSSCDEFNRNTIKDICEKADEIAEKLTNNDVNEEDAHNELKDVLNSYSLRYCSKFALKDVVSKVNRKRLLRKEATNGTCTAILSELVQLDALVNFFSCEFDEVLSRIYCQGYSVKETCDECSVSFLFVNYYYY